MDLYKLPKDMLVKLITTIEKETRDKYEVKLKAYRELLFKIGINFSICSEEGCGENSLLPFQQCDYCFLSYCKKHEKEKFTCCEK